MEAALGGLELRQQELQRAVDGFYERLCAPSPGPGGRGGRGRGPGAHARSGAGQFASAADAALEQARVLRLTDDLEAFAREHGIQHVLEGTVPPDVDEQAVAELRAAVDKKKRRADAARERFGAAERVFGTS